MSFVQMLRAATAADHDRVDARFGGFVLDDEADYRRFLVAHARALPAVEIALAADFGLPAWRRRTDLLASDLAGMGQAMPVPLAFAADGAARWGALYVIEGSRLGGQLLARGVPEGLPATYLAARHSSGEWRALLGAIETRAGTENDVWREAAVAGARATFALYVRAVEA
jgi:heme oxygenase